jgi:hypothetical protein
LIAGKYYRRILAPLVRSDVSIGKTYRRAPPRDGVPALLRREPSGVAAQRAPARDIREGLEAAGVQPGIEESQRGLAGGDQGVVHEGDDGAGGGRRGTGAVEPEVGAVPGGHEVEALGGDVWVTAAVPVVQSVEGAVQGGDVVRHHAVLVGWPFEVIAEAAAGAEVIYGVPGDDLGAVVHGGADGGDVRAGGGEFREEGGGILAVIAEACAKVCH